MMPKPHRNSSLSLKTEIDVNLIHIFILFYLFIGAND